MEVEIYSKLVDISEANTNKKGLLGIKYIKDTLMQSVTSNNWLV